MVDVAVLFGIVILLIGIVVCFLIGTFKNFKKITKLDGAGQQKIWLLDSYMAVVRKLTADELLQLSKMPDEDLLQCNAATTMNERLKLIRAAIH
jgi:hypothetical protein